MSAKIADRIPPAPYLVLRDRLLRPGQSQAAVARALGVSDARLSLLLNGRRITPDMALRIGRFLDTPADYWLQLQMDYDLFQARERYARELEEAKPPVA